MPRAACLVLDRVPYRGTELTKGLRAVGFDVVASVPQTIAPDDVLVVWNRSAVNDKFAQRYEAVGARVIVVENGYLGREWRGGYWYALALGQHGGAGVWSDGGPQRWDGWNIDVAPWRSGGDDIMVFAQRGIGERSLRSPAQWETKTQGRLLQMTRRPARIRRHPGIASAGIPLVDDLRNAWACVTWSSGAALKALLMGVPVFYECPTWVGASAARPLGHDIEDPFRGDRLPMLRRMAWAMWNVDEIASGEPFRRLLA